MRLVFALVVTLGALPATAAPGELSRVSRASLAGQRTSLDHATPLQSPRPNIDWTTIRERTRQYEAHERASRLLLPDYVMAPRGRELLSRARVLLGPVPAGFRRFSFPSAPTEVEARALLEAEDLLLEFDRELKEGVGSAREVLALQQQRVASVPELSIRVEAEQRTLAARSSSAAELLSAARQRVSERRGGFGARLRYWVAQIRGNSAPALTARLERSIQEWGGTRAVLGAELTYIRGALQAEPLPAQEVTPAYAEGDATLALEDTAAGREIEQTSEIAARAAELRTPAAVYEFVKNEFRLDWYYGSLKGTGETFRSRRGNDVDLASVCIALLRAQGVAARYVRGTIELPIARVAELMGLLTAEQIDAVAAGGPVPSLVRDRVLTALPAVGIPFQPVAAGGTVQAVRFVHTWVEAYVPYGNYRGRGAGTGARSWVPLDPALPGAAKFAAQPPQVDALSVSSLTAPTLVQDYLESAPTTSPVAFIRDRVGAALVSAGSTYSDALRTVAQRPEPLGFVPGSLPFKVIAVHGESAFLPEEVKHRLRFVVSDANGPVVEHIIPLHRVVGHRTLFAWEAATSADADAIAAAGGLYEAPASAVQLVPVLRVDGQVQATGTRSMGLGAQAAWRLELLLPDGSSRVVDNEVIAGNVVAIGLGGPGNAYVEPAEDPSGWQDGQAPRFLYSRAAEYATRWTEAEEELARLLQVVPLRPTASLVLVENQLAVDEVLGVRRRVVWKGLQIDADHRALVPLELVPGRDKDLFRLSGLQGSYLEADVLRDATGVEAVAAVSVLQEAHRRGADVLTITSATAAADLLRLMTTAGVRREVEDQIARGREVTIPSADLTIGNWTGTGFIARDTRTEEAGYFLSGVVSGGQTIISPGSWTDQALVDRLARPDAPSSIADTSQVARILLLPDTTQEVTVGETAPRPMTVVVTTIKGVPIQGAEVRFRGVGQSNPSFSGPAGQPSPGAFTVRTDLYGKARAWVTPDTDIGTSAIVRQGNPNQELVGLSQIIAETSGPGTPNIALLSPWFVLAHHDEPSSMDVACSPISLVDGAAMLENYCRRSGYAGLEFTEPVFVQVRDRFGNWVPNTSVAWTSATGSGRFVPVSGTDRVRVLDPADSNQRISTELITATDGLVYTAYIPGFRQFTPHGFTGEVLYARAGSAFARFALHTTIPSDPATAGLQADQVAFRMRGTRNEDNAGIYGTRWRQPVGLQFLRWTGTTWEVISGSEPGFHAEVHMDVYQVASTTSTKTLLYSEIVDPAATSTLATGVWADFDDSRTAMFWPKYDVDNGWQEWDFHARFRLEDGSTWRTREYGWVAESRRPKVEVFRVLPGRIETKADEFGYASRDDLAVTFRVSNPASYPIYARILQEPRTSGQSLVELPPVSDATPRHPSDPSVFLVHPKGQNRAGDQFATTSFELPLVRATDGGKVRLQVLVPNGSEGTLESLTWAESVARIEPPWTAIVAPDETIKATAIIVVRNFESAATPLSGQIGPATSTEPPILIPAPLAFRVRGAGTLRITMGGREVAAAQVGADQDGNVTSLDVWRSSIPIVARADGSLRADIPPSDPTIHDVTIAFTAGNDTKTRAVPFVTELVDASPLPIGHTFVKDVSVVDGHIQKSFTDIAVPGRNGGLKFARSYTSRGLDAVTSMGAGWTHSYRSFVTRDISAGRIRWMVVGGEGGGQLFDCGMSNVCRPQRGYHGQLKFVDPPAGTPHSEGQAVVYVARSGTEYRYTRRRTDERAQERIWLTSIVDPRGNETYLEYADASFGGELLRVFEPGNRRLLQFKYDWPGAAPRPLLRSVSLQSNPSNARTPPADGFPAIDDSGMCVEFEQDAIQNLVAVKRYDGACRSGAPVLRTEAFTYCGGWTPGLRSNLTSYTDPNGRTTSYVYADAPGAPAIAGGSAYMHLADLEERVWQVTEPSPGGTTTFAYSLVPEQVSVLGRVRPLFKTVVTPARAAAAPTTYLLDSYGASSKVIRGGAERTTVWDPVHVRPVSETDPRGRTVVMSYDDRGNLTARRTSTRVLPGGGGVPPTEPLVDKNGEILESVVERWEYDPAYGGETCRVDAEGRITTIGYALGLPVERREYATPVDPSVATSSCSVLLAQAQQSDRDRVTRFTYCNVTSGATCGGIPGAVTGDLVGTADGPRLGAGRTFGTRQTTVSRYDAYGSQEVTSLSMPGSTGVVTTRVHDARGRVIHESDNLGHEAHHGYDGLDRVRWTERVNRRGASPGEYRTYAYFDGGQLRAETLGATADPATIRWSKTVALDGLNLAETVTETASTGTGAKAFATITRHDAAGNVWQAVDRRGVRKTTYFDELDRPRSVQLDIEDTQVFAAGGGETPPSFGAIPRTIASYTYDSAGNKLTETDVHGHTTQFVVDPLYRTVAVIAPEVPAGFVGGGGGTEQWLVRRRFDLVGNRVREVENTSLSNPAGGLVTTWTYDFANRVVETIDPAGGFERRTYDGLGEVDTVTKGHRAANEVVYLAIESKGYDPLGRALGVTETIADVDGTRTVQTDLAYEDASRTTFERDRRGAVHRRRLDDLDRLYEETADVSGAPLSRRSPALAFTALELTTQYEYDEAGRRTAVVDPLGRRTEDVYDGLGRLEQRKMPMGVSESTRYDGEGNVISRTDRRGVTTTSSFDPLGRETARKVLESITRNGQELTILTRQYSDTAGTEGLTSATEIDARGNATIRTYDALHREVRTQDAANKSTLTRYDAKQRRGVQDRKGYVTEFDQDAVGRPTAQREKVRVTASASWTQSWSYDDQARTETWTDRSGIVTVTRRDGVGRARTLTRGVAPLQSVETTAYDEGGLVVRVDDPNGHAVAFGYDGAGRKRTETRAFGSSVAATTTFTYDAAGNRVATKGPRGTWDFDVRETYDDLNRSVRTEVPAEDPQNPTIAVTSRAFDGAGNKLCEKRPLGGDPLGGGGAAGMSVSQLESMICGGGWPTPVVQGTRFRYDELSKLTSVIDANGGEHSFVYDEARNLVAKQDANENLTVYGYDTLNRRTDEWQHLDGHARLRTRVEVEAVTDRGFGNAQASTGSFNWHVAYDDSGNPETRTDPRGISVTSSFGILNRVESVTYPDDPGLPAAYPFPVRTTYAYDGNGNVELVTEVKRFEPATVTTLVTDAAYDGLGRLWTEQRHDGKVVTYDYYPKGNRRKVTDPDGVETSYEYDAQDRLTSVTTPAGIATHRYWPDGLLKGTSLPNGLEEARCYDPAGRVTAIVTARAPLVETCASPASPVTRFDYGYDLNGNRSRQVERRTDPASATIGGAEETRYGYDVADRLVGVAYPDRTVLYQLDAVGNRTGERVAPAPNTLALTVASYGGAATGLTSDLTTTFNRVDWLTSQTDAVDSTRNASYGYDNAGNLTQKSRGGTVRQLRWSFRNTLTAVLQGPSAAQLAEVGRYDYDANLQRLSRQTVQEQVEYVLDDRHVLQEASASAGHPSYRRYHYGEGPLLVEDGSTRRFISTDALGSTTDLTTAGGTVASMRKYDAWGQYRNDTAPLANEPKLGFTGHQYDPETGLVYARARYYDPDLGRFLSRDSYEGSLSEAPSLHRFMYVRGNPLRYTDPSGLRDMTAEEAARDAEWAKAQAQAKAAWEAMPWYKKVVDFFDSSGSRETSRILARNINAYRTGIAQAADGEAVAKIDVAAEYGEAPGTVRLPSGDQELSRQPLIVPASKVAAVQASRARAAATINAVRGGGVATAITAAVTRDDATIQTAGAIEAPAMALAASKMVANGVQADLRDKFLVEGTSLQGALPQAVPDAAVAPVPAVAAAPPEAPTAYSTAFEVVLPKAEFGRSRSVHFNQANATLDATMRSDAEFAQTMEGLIPGCGAAVCKWQGRQNPPGWTWEHASTSTAQGREGVMRLVPTPQHTPGSPFWRVIHPDVGAAGGYSEWAIPAGAPEN